ncbi:MAG: DNA primase [Bacillota bacterium]
MVANIVKLVEEERMGSGPHSQILEELRHKSDIVQLVGEYVVLKKAGRYFKGLCPFHNEKTPSFHVDPEKQLFHCFGCGIGGDIISFLEKIEGLDFKGAVQFLGDKYGVRTSLNAPEASPQEKLKQRIYDLNQLIARYYRYLLEHSGENSGVSRYLAKRGINAKVSGQFNLGWSSARSGLLPLLEKKRIPLDIAEKAGLIIKGRNGYYDRFRDRLMFPIHDATGRIIGFGGRLIGDGQPKYLNSPETAVYSKGRNLYGLDHAKEYIRKNAAAIIVEGYFDVISAVQHGIENVVASLGTSFTAEQAKLLKRYTEKVYIAYDSDTAGQAATLRGTEILAQEGLKIKMVKLPENEDPDSFCQNEGGDAFRELVDKALDLDLYRFMQIIQKKDHSTLEGKIKVLQSLLPFLHRLKSPLAQEEYLLKAGKYLDVSEEILRMEYSAYKKLKDSADINTRKRNNKEEKLGAVLLKNQTESGPPKAVIEAEEIIVKILLENGKFLSHIRSMGFTGDYLVNPLSKEIYTQICSGMDVKYLLENSSQEQIKFMTGIMLKEYDFEIDETYLNGIINRLKAFYLQQKLKELEKEIIESGLRNDDKKYREKSVEQSLLKEELSRIYSFLSI